MLSTQEMGARRFREAHYLSNWKFRRWVTSVDRLRTRKLEGVQEVKKRMFSRAPRADRTTPGRATHDSQNDSGKALGTSQNMSKEGKRKTRQ